MGCRHHGLHHITTTDQEGTRCDLRCHRQVVKNNQGNTHRHYHSTPDVANLFFQHVFRHFGLPSIIILDRDARFTGKFWQTLWAKLGTKLAMSTAFHPQTDGQMERANQVLEQVLRNYTIYKQDNWDELLPFTEFAYNNSVNSATGFSLFHILSDRKSTPGAPLYIPPTTLRQQPKWKILPTSLT